MREYILGRIYEYIENDIDYIEKYDYEAGKNDLMFLKSLNESDIKKINESVINDGELESDITRAIDECIHYYLYHYKKGE